MDLQLLTQCSSIIYVANRQSVDGHGDPRWTRAVKVQARVEKIQQVKNSSGDGGGMQKEETKTKVYTQDEIKVDDLVWLPGYDFRDTNEGQTPERVDMFRDERGNIDHYETVL